MMATARSAVQSRAMANLFPSFLRGVMDGNGMSPAEFARSLGVTHSTVSRWLDGSSLPTIATLRKLAERFRVSPGELLVSSGIFTEAELGITAGKPEPYAPVLTDIQKFIKDKRTSKGLKQQVLHLARGILHMALEARDGVPHEPSAAERSR